MAIDMDIFDKNGKKLDLNNIKIEINETDSAWAKHVRGNEWSMVWRCDSLRASTAQEDLITHFMFFDFGN